jgi:hypothetical protein
MPVVIPSAGLVVRDVIEVWQFVECQVSYVTTGSPLPKPVPGPQADTSSAKPQSDTRHLGRQDVDAC